MTVRIPDFLHWIGVWTGIGETQAGQPCYIRNRFYLELDGQGLGMHFEAWDPGLTTLYHGVRAVLAAAPSGVMRALAFSTIQGPLTLDLTEDDEGVMALAGQNLAGHRISVTFVQEDPGRLLFTAFWRPPQQARSEGPSMSCLLTRNLPWQPPQA
jgi:hypothetical protein